MISPYATYILFDLIYIRPQNARKHFLRALFLKFFRQSMSPGASFVFRKPILLIANKLIIIKLYLRYSTNKNFNCLITEITVT